MSLSNSTKAALRQAEREGLTLLRSESSSSGYKGVCFDRRLPSNPYKLRFRRGGKIVTLGYFATAEEAALCYARTPEGQATAAAPPVPPLMTAEEALRQVEEEGLTLVRSAGSSTGYKGVRFNSRYKSKPCEVQAWLGGTKVHLGRFATPEEAALHLARASAAQAAAAAPPEPPITSKEAVRQAEAEGLTLLRSDSSSGYKGVTFNSNRNLAKPYQAHVYRGRSKVAFGTKVYLGHFATAEEAALCYARSPEAQTAAAAPPAPPPMTAEEALRQAEEEALTLLRSGSSSTGYKGVAFNTKSSKSSKSKSYWAKAWRGGKNVSLGYFVTAEEAALHVARDLAAAAQVASPQPPAASSRKRKAKSEEQPPDMPADDVVILEGQFVTFSSLVR